MSCYERLEAASFLDDPSQPLQSVIQAPTLPFDVATAGFNPLIEPHSEVRTSPVLTSAPWLFETWLQSAGDHAMPQGVRAVASIDDSGFAASSLAVGPSSAMTELAPQTPRRGAPKRTKASSASPSKREKTFACRECCRKKIRCNGAMPCSNCNKQGLVCRVQAANPRTSKQRIERIINELAEAITEAPEFGAVPLDAACDLADQVFETLVEKAQIHNPELESNAQTPPAGPSPSPARRASSSRHAAQSASRYHPYHADGRRASLKHESSSPSSADPESGRLPSHPTPHFDHPAYLLVPPMPTRGDPQPGPSEFPRAPTAMPPSTPVHVHSPYGHPPFLLSPLGAPTPTSMDMPSWIPRASGSTPRPF